MNVIRKPASHRRKHNIKIRKLALIVSVLGAVVTGLPIAAQGKTSLFAYIPLHLQEKTTVTTSAGAKPNVMLFIDDSGSMDTTLPYTTTTDVTKYKCQQRTRSYSWLWGYGAWSSWSWVDGLSAIPSNTDTTQYQNCASYTVSQTTTSNISRINLTKNVLQDVLNQYRNKMYFGLQTLNNNNNVNVSTYQDTSTDAGYNLINSKINQLAANSGTPTTRRYYEVTKNILIPGQKYRCQKSYIVLMSDGDANLSCQSGYTQFGNLNDNYYGQHNRGSCVNASGGNYDNFWDINTGLQFFSNTLNTKNFGPYIGGGTDAAGKSWSEINPKTGAAYQQTAQTFTIGFASGLSSNGRTYLSNGATPPGTYDASTNPNARFFAANGSADIINAFSTIFDNISSDNQLGEQQAFSVTAPSISTSPSSSSGLAVAASLDTGTWSSQLHIYNMGSGGSVDTSSYKLPSFGNRALLLSDGSNTYLYNSALPATWKNNPYFNFADNGSNSREWLDGLLAWYNRTGTNDSLLKQSNYVLDYRARDANARDMGDVIDNPIVSIGDQVNAREEFLVTSANDGMVYVFQSAADTNHPYDLKFNFMPMAMQRLSNDNSDTVAKYYPDLLSGSYGKNEDHPHQYLLNGGMVVRRTDTSKPQQIYLASTMGQAGRGAFAINVGGKDRVSGNAIAASKTGSGSLATEVPLFETAKGVDNQFGFTVGSPAIARVRVNAHTGASATDLTQNIREAAFVANGYNYSNSYATDTGAVPSAETALYVYDAMGLDVGTAKNSKDYTPGDLIKKFVVSGGVGGLSSPTVVDTDFDGVVDVAYAGDYGGNLYRFDLRDPNPANWSVTKIFSGVSTQPITAAPATSRINNQKYVVIFGTGSDIYQSDLTNTDQQTVYGIYDDLTKTNTDALVAKSDLLQQTISTAGTYRYLSNKKLAATNRGWYFNLENNGERVVVKPDLLLKTGALTTRTYQTSETSTGNGDQSQQDPCASTSVTVKTSAYSWWMQFNALTGGALTTGDTYINFNNINGDGYYASGQKMAGLSNFTFVDGSRNGSSVSRDGDSGGSGTEPELGVKPQSNSCFSSSNNFVVGVDAAGNTMNYGVHGSSCNITVRRLSWREIFSAYGD